MLRRDNVDVGHYIDTEFSSGDSNRTKTKQHYQEENNNEVNELSKELSEMGCIVDAVKRPPNICIETCVYESDNEEVEESKACDEDAYSDEFEDDKSEDEESIPTGKSQLQSVNGRSQSQPAQSSTKLTKSQSSMSNKPPCSVSGKSGYGISLPPTRRINMSFTNERLREIERHNHILLTKILSARNTKKSSIPPRDQLPRRPMPSAAVLRKNQQRQIDRDNMILLKKIQRAKSTLSSSRR